MITSYQTKLDAAPTRESELTELMRDYTTLQGQYTSLLGKREESKLAANLERRQIGEHAFLGCCSWRHVPHRLEPRRHGGNCRNDQNGTQGVSGGIYRRRPPRPAI